MPIYEYQVTEPHVGCAHCAQPFELMQRMADAPLTQCPQCGAPVHRIISRPAVGRSQSGEDGRAKAAGFHKLQRRGKGEYEVKY